MKGPDDTQRMCLTAVCFVLEESGAESVQDIANACEMLIHVASMCCAAAAGRDETLRRMDDMRGVIAQADDAKEDAPAPAGVVLQ
jgi:hypothetical protein